MPRCAKPAWGNHRAPAPCCPELTPLSRSRGVNIPKAPRNPQRARDFPLNWLCFAKFDNNTPQRHVAPQPSRHPSFSPNWPHRPEPIAQHSRANCRPARSSAQLGLFCKFADRVVSPVPSPTRFTVRVPGHATDNPTGHTRLSFPSGFVLQKSDSHSLATARTATSPRNPHIALDFSQLALFCKIRNGARRPLHPRFPRSSGRARNPQPTHPTPHAQWLHSAAFRRLPAGRLRSSGAVQ
jgi:hypothetical protein